MISSVAHSRSVFTIAHTVL